MFPPCHVCERLGLNRTNLRSSLYVSHAIEEVIALSRGLLAEIPREALMRSFEVLAHGFTCARRIAQGDRIADGDVPVRRPPGSSGQRVPFELLEIRIDAESNSWPTQHQHAVAENPAMQVETPIAHEKPVADKTLSATSASTPSSLATFRPRHAARLPRLHSPRRRGPARSRTALRSKHCWRWLLPLRLDDVDAGADTDLQPPSTSSAIRASRTVGRETPSCVASSRSAGSRLPTGNSP